MKKPLADDIEIVIAQENDTLAAAADRRQRRGKTVSTGGFRFLICNESMGVTSPFLSCGGAAVNVRGGCRGIFATCRKAYNLHWVFGVDGRAARG